LGGPTYDLFARRERRVFKVGELTREIKGLLEGRYALVFVEGEISNFRRNSASGHCYFTLKDDGASLRCVLFKAQAKLLPFQPGDGQHVVARGRVSVWEPSGEYNLVCDTLEPVGAGVLALRFEELKRRLAAEGLFDAAAKRPLPVLPRRVGLVTSPTGAAVQDFLRVLHRRFPNMPVLVAPARVQGEGAAAEICKGIQRLGAIPDVDVVVLARGGGSMEDLWAFNEEPVARAIRRCPVPVVSAIGHETDFTISDFASDLRAPTPTAAAELVVRPKADFAEALQVAHGRLRRALARRMDQSRARLDAMRKALSDPRRVIGERRLALDRLLSRQERIFRERLKRARGRLADTDQRLARAHPRVRLAAVREAIARMHQRAERSAHARQAQATRQLETLAGRLDALSPLKVLSRGFALARDGRGRLVRRATDLSVGDTVRVRVAEGSFDAGVTAVRAPGEDA